VVRGAEDYGLNSRSHSEPSFGATDWPQIAGLYAELARHDPSPVVAVNRAVAVGFAEGAQAGLAILPDDPRLDRYALQEGMELAFLTAIQRLPGRQRAILILRDVLGWTGAEAAELLETTVTAVNSALQRARATIEAEAAAHRVAPGRGTQRELLRRYVDAWERADMSALRSLRREDVVMTMPPEDAVIGSAAIVAFFERRCGGSLRASATWANGRPAVELRNTAGALHRLLVLDVRDDRIGYIAAYRPNRSNSAGSGNPVIPAM
jgi:hypothetical protein